MIKHFAFFVLFLTICGTGQVLSQAKPLAAFKIDNYWYFLDESGKELFPAQEFEGVGSFSEGKFYAKKREKDTSLFYYFDISGKELFPVNTYLPFNFVYGRCLTVKFLDEKGDKRIYGFKKDNGETLYENVLEDGLDFSDSLAYIQKGDDRGYIGLDGKFKFKIDPMDIGYRFSEGLAAVSNNDFLFSFIDKTGKTVIPFKYDEVGEFREGLCKAYLGNKFGFINKKGDLLINNVYDDTHNFSEGMAFVGKFGENFNVKWGFINKDGVVIEDFIYSIVLDFSEGLAAVNLNEKWGFIDKDGKTVIDFKYTQADSFKNGLAFVVDKINGKAGYIDKTGKFFFDFVKYDILIDWRTNQRFYSFKNK